MTEAENRLAAFLETLAKLPPFAGVTFRGCTSDAEFVRDGQSVVTQGLVPTSRDLDVATEGQTSPAVYAILSAEGRYIAPFSARADEQEVVFQPGTVFYLAQTRYLAGVDVRLVYEVLPGDASMTMPDDSVAEFASRMEAFLLEHGPARGPSTSIPGKFAGDIS